MSSPEMEAAATRLLQEGLLSPEVAARAVRIARRDLVSVRGPLRFVLTCGILLFATGVGLFVKENAGRIGPVAIAAGLALAAAAALAFVWRGAPPFTWEAVPDLGPLRQAMLLLGALLLASDLAWIEAQMKVLGEAWAYHLLAVALVYAALAYRHDSRPLLSMALTSFAAWRGVTHDTALGMVDTLLGGRDRGLRANAFLCAAVFAAGAWHAGRGHKRHFEPVYSNFAILVLFLGLGSGAFSIDSGWPLWAFLLVGTGVAVALAARKRKRPLWFAQGAVAVWLGLCRVLFAVFTGSLDLLFSSLLSLVFFVILVKETRALKEDA